MTKVLIDLDVTSLAAATKFYCDELALFDFHQDYGMGTVSLVCKANESILLLLTERAPVRIDRPVFRLEVESCEATFNRLKAQSFETGGKLLSQEIFEYPLEQSVALQDPAGNTFILFELN